MISVVIPTHDDEAVLGRTLGPLVAAAVSGLVREVILADGGSVDATLDIGEDAGCRVVAGEGSDDIRARVAAEDAVGDGDPLMLMESLPYGETRAYVEKVMANYWIYRRLFGQPVHSVDALASGEPRINLAMDR